MILDDHYKIVMLWAAVTISTEFHNVLERWIMTIFVLLILGVELIAIVEPHIKSWLRRKEVA